MTFKAVWGRGKWRAVVLVFFGARLQGEEIRQSLGMCRASE